MESSVAWAESQVDTERKGRGHGPWGDRRGLRGRRTQRGPEAAGTVFKHSPEPGSSDRKAGRRRWLRRRGLGAHACQCEPGPWAAGKPGAGLRGSRVQSPLGRTACNGSCSPESPGSQVLAANCLIQVSSFKPKIPTYQISSLSSSLKLEPIKESNKSELEITCESSTKT